MLLRRQKVLAMATSAHDPKHQSRVTRATEYSIGARIERSVRYSTVVSRFVLFDIEGPSPERATESIASNHSLIQPLMIVNTSLSSCCQHARIKKNSKPMRFAAQIRAARAHARAGLHEDGRRLYREALWPGQHAHPASRRRIVTVPLPIELALASSQPKKPHPQADAVGEGRSGVPSPLAGEGQDEGVQPHSNCIGQVGRYTPRRLFVEYAADPAFDVHEKARRLNAG